MRLKSAIIRNYRIHQEKEIRFDPGLTLISGANETGKSTLVEAIHRALFLRSKVGGDVFREMKSFDGGEPRVELVCEFSGRDCRIDKTFKGGKGETIVAMNGEAPIQGDAAEEKLAELLGGIDPLDGKGAAGQLLNRWAHLWVWQGCSGEQPAGLAKASGQNEALMRRLQEKGGAGVVQSTLDAKVLGLITGRRNTLYTEGDKPKPKASSDEARILREVQSIEAEHQQAADVVARLEEAAARLIQIRGELSEKTGAMERGDGELAEASRKLAEAGALRIKIKDMDLAIQQSSDMAANLQKVAGDLAAAREAVKEAEAGMQSSAAALAGMKKEAEACRAAHAVAEAALEQARAAAAHANAARTALSEQAMALEKKQALDQLKRRQADIDAKTAESTKFKKDLAKLPQIEAEDLEELQELHQAVSAAEATLAALGASIVLLAGKQQVSVDGEALAVGERHIITADTEVVIGAGTRLKICPGGETSIAEARQVRDTAREDADRKLLALGFKTLREAAEAKQKRDALGHRIEMIEAELDGLGAGTHSDELIELQGGYEDAVRRATAAAVDARIALPADRAALQAQRQDADRAVTAAGVSERAAKSAWTEAHSRLEKALQADEAATRLQAEWVTMQGGARARVSTLEEQYGTDEERALRANRNQAGLDQAKSRREALDQEVRFLQPEQRQMDVDRLSRAAARLQSDIGQLQNEQAALRERLRQHGTTDPHADLEDLRARLERVQARHAELVRQGVAIRHLSDLAAEVQADVARQFAKPLADAVQGYLDCLFGVGTGVNLKMDEAGHDFSGLTFSRATPGFGACEFEQLSGGTREQVGVAFRLAMAEVLAADHGGCLPVVLDDAFANSDPDRVRLLQRMLDLAARRGLQVIVLTCTPADYSTLGAAEVRLARPVSRSREVAVARAVPDHSLPEGGPEPDSTEEPGAVEGEDKKFLSALEQLGGKSSNRALKEKLGVDDVLYQKTKDALIMRGLIMTGRGYGGSVRIP